MARSFTESPASENAMPMIECVCVSQNKRRTYFVSDKLSRWVRARENGVSVFRVMFRFKWIINLPCVARRYVRFNGSAQCVIQSHRQALTCARNQVHHLSLATLCMCNNFSRADRQCLPGILIPVNMPIAFNDQKIHFYHSHHAKSKLIRELRKKICLLNVFRFVLAIPSTHNQIF